MRLKVIPLFALAICTLATHRQAFPQEGKAEAPRTFLVTILEGRLSEQSKASEANAERLWADLRDSSKTDWLETVQFTVLDGHKTRVMFGRKVPVVAGITESQHGKTRNMVDKPIGTGVSLAIKGADEKLALEVEYQSSRLSGENSGELPPPALETSDFESTLLLSLGKPKLLVASPNTCLMILIELDGTNK